MVGESLILCENRFSLFKYKVHAYWWSVGVSHPDFAQEFELHEVILVRLHEAIFGKSFIL